MKSNRVLPPAWTGLCIRSLHWLPGLALAAFLLANLHGISGGFFSDDILYIVQNDALQSLGLAELWKVFPYSARFNGIDWGPLRDLAYKAVFAAFGAQPMPFKLLNYAVYAATVLAAYRAARAVLPIFEVRQEHPAPAAAIAAALFAVHPLHVESVQAIWGLKDLLMTGFGLAALPPFVRWLRTRDRKALAASAVLLACAGMSKGVAISLLAPVWLLAYAAQETPAIGQRAWCATRAFLPVAALPAVVFAAFLYASPLQETFNVGDVHNWIDRPLIILGGQALIALLPWPLSLIYAPYGTWMPAYLALGTVMFAALLWSAGTFARKPTAWSFGLLFFVALTLPYLQLMPFSTTSMIADRFGFAAVFGLCIAVAAAVMRLPRRYCIPAASALLVTLVALTALRASGWDDPHALQAADEQRTQPETTRAEHVALARMMEQVGQITLQVKTRGGRMTQREADALIAYLADVQRVLAQPRAATADIAALAFHGRIENDIAGIYQGIYEYFGAHPSLGTDASTHFLRNGRYRQAQQWAQLALATHDVPRDQLAIAYKNLGIALAAQGNIAGGADALHRSLRVQPQVNLAACVLRDLARSYPAQLASDEQMEQLCVRTLAAF